MDGLEVRKRFEALVMQRKTIEQVWQDIEEFFVPWRGEFFRDLDSEHEVEYFRENLFDSTGPHAAATLASSIHGASMSSSVKWFDLVFRDKALKKDQEANKWLSTCGDIVYQTLQESNFALESAEACIDITTFGTAVMTEELVSENILDWQGITFSAVPIVDSYFEHDHLDNVVKFYRRYRWTPVQIIEKFGEENVCDYIKEKAKSSEGIDTKEVVIFCVYKRNNQSEPEGVVAPELRPYGYKYILEKDASQLGEEGGYYEMPAFTPRWLKISGSRWGHSPAFIALADTKTANRLTELVLRSGEKVLDPATLVEQRGLFSDLDLSPSGITVVRDINAIRPYESGARFDVSQLRLDQLQESIRNYFHINELMLKDSPAMTATETEIRYELMMRLLGPTLGRIQYDLLRPVIERTFGILYRAGRFPEPPKSVLESQSELDIEYYGPMSRAQKSQKASAIQRWLAFINEIAQVEPEAGDIPNFDDIVKEMARLLDVSPDLQNDKGKVTAIRDQRQQRQQVEDQLARAQAGGAAAKSIGEGMEKMNAAQST